VVLADDNFIVRDGIEQILAACEELELVASCSDLDSLLEAIDREAPDVVLTDIRMPPSETDEGIQVAARMRKEHPETGDSSRARLARPRRGAGSPAPGTWLDGAKTLEAAGLRE
jgi:DNA-binding NarL/FixJ family response regulator